jgi:Protein of unknown function (DUF2917)
MAEEAQERSVKQEAADPYGDVALGVECAWPQTLPALQAMPSDAGGRIWITEEAGNADVVLRPGESFRLARRGLAVVEALSDASISVRFQL